MWISSIDTILRGVAVGLASSVTVGPVAVLCIKRTLSKSFLSGFISGVGVACADTLLAIFAFFVYSLVEAQINEYKDIISVIGGLFVVVVGVVIYFQKPKAQAGPKRSGAATLWRDFASMFGFTLANFVAIIPYILAFFAMLGISQHEGPIDASSTRNSILILSGFLVGATIWWLVLTALISLFRRGFRPHHMQMINRVAGIVITCLGIITIITTFITSTTSENGVPTSEQQTLINADSIGNTNIKNLDATKENANSSVSDTAQQDK